MTVESLIRRSKIVVTKFKNKTYTRNEACDKLEGLYNQAWKEEPNSEPDGDIEYTIALALEEIYSSKQAENYET